MAACVEHPDAAHDVHAGNDLAECREALAVRVAGATEIEAGLGADADEEFGAAAGAGGVAGERNGAVEVAQAGDGGTFVFDRRALVGVGARAALYYVDARVAAVVVGAYDAEEAAAIVGAGIDVAKDLN